VRTYGMVKVTLNTTTLTLLSDRFTRKLQYCHLFDLKLGVTYFDTETPIYVSVIFHCFFFYLETFRKVIWRLLATIDSRYMMSVTICSWPKYFHMQSYPPPPPIQKHLEIKEIPKRASSSSFLDIYLEFQIKWSTRCYEKRDGFKFAYTTATAWLCSLYFTNHTLRSSLHFVFRHFKTSLYSEY
jgi:hypothetical protein